FCKSSQVGCPHPLDQCKLRCLSGVEMRNRLGILLGVLCTVSAVLAQSVTGTVGGVVRDPTGAVVPGVKVTAINMGTRASFRATANSEGQYAIRALPVGEYRLEAETPGFRKFESASIRLQVDEIARVDIALAIDTAAESITVTDAVVAVNTDTPTLK